MNTHDINNDLNLVQIRLESALRAQRELERKEAELAATRQTLAAAKGDTAALQAQLRDAMERSVRNQLEKADNEARIAQAQAETKAAAEASALAAKVATAHELTAKLETIKQHAREADEALALYVNKLAAIKALKTEVVRGLRYTFISEAWQDVPSPGMEIETREGRSITEGLMKNSTDVRPVSGYSVTSTAVTSFTTLAGSYLIGFTK
jgi:hypothetical protein